jgi:predicted O-linked N-acetylglucosamine transferase (SPINDLY family)
MLSAPLSALWSRLSGRTARRTPRDLNAAGLAALDDGALDSALAAFEGALAADPGSADTRVNLASVHLMASRHAAAAAALEEALRIAPEHPAAHCNYGMLLAQTGRYDAAAQHLRRVPRTHAAIRAADINLTNALMHGCQWDALDAHLAARLEARSADPGWWRSIEPFQAALLGIDPGIARALADAHAADLAAGAGPALALPVRGAGARLRLGYLSADFRHHATMDLLLETLEAHDHACHEIVLYSYGPDDGSPERRRAMAAADRFVDVGRDSHSVIARAIAQDGIDVLVDLKGHTGEGRPQVVALRPAPVIVSYLGYPGTMGGRLADWYFGDAVSTPPGSDANFSECVYRLPGTYQANSAWHALPAPPARAALGLPDDAPVFCCFNAPYKVGRATFAAWMTILRAVPGSVLWLLAGDRDALARLAQAAESAGIDARRLVFADPVPRDAHLVRMAAADVFVDTWPCCAHTLASDALRAGVPIVTLPGAAFASRVAASVLEVVGLGELVCPDVEAYVDAAVQLARDPQRRAQLRERIATGRARLFNPTGHARALEDAYAVVHESAGRN